MKPSKILAVSALSLGLIAFTGCDDAQEGAKGAAKEEALPNINVELPPSPDFDENKAPEKWEDGHYSIYGLRDNMDDRIKDGEAGTEITLKGYVQEVYVPPVCAEGELCPPGKQPHFWITDKPDQKGKKRALMIVSYKFQIPEWELPDWEGVPWVTPEVGKPIVLKGKFVRFSDTGFADITGGLVDFVAYEAPNPETGQTDASRHHETDGSSLEIALIEARNSTHSS
jgi:hypothetical protein